MCSRSEAKNLGLKTYNSTLNCRNGHVSPVRYVLNNNCFHCAKEQYKKNYELNREKYLKTSNDKWSEVKQDKDNLSKLNALRRSRYHKNMEDKLYATKRKKYNSDYKRRPEVAAKAKAYRNKSEIKEINKIKRKILAEQIKNDPLKSEQIKLKRKRYKQQNKDKVLAATRYRQCIKRQRVVIWADLKKIEEIYKLRVELTEKTGILHHVDHIIPLIHPLVCGLHTEHNLRVIPAEENLSKHNKFEIT